jgi:hypothetical protein
MRWMARKASLFTIHRSMIDGDFLPLLFVAVKTKGIAFLDNELRIF